MCSAFKRIKVVLAGMVISLSMMVLSTGCSKTPTGFTPETGSADVTINLGRVGSLGKTAATVTIDLTKVIVSITSGNDKVIADTIILSGNQGRTVMKTYDKLTCDKEWTLTVWTEDAKGVVVHSGGKAFRVEAGKTTAVSLDLNAIYSMLVAHFCPIPDSVTRCELLIDGIKVDDIEFTKQSLLGDTIGLSYDYLETNVSQRIKLDVYGEMYGINSLLYTGDTMITPLPGINANYTVILKWVGPNVLPSGQIVMTISFGPVGTVTVNGLIRKPNSLIELMKDERVTTIELDGDYIWTGTNWYSEKQDKIIRYNRKTSEYTIYTTENARVPIRFIQCMTLDSSGNLWAGGESGSLAYFKEGKWTSFLSGSVFYANRGPTCNDISALLTDADGNIWVGAWCGVWEYKGTQCTTHKISYPGPIYAFFLDHAKNVWATGWGNTSYSTAYFDGTEWHFDRSGADNLWSGTGTNNCYDMAEDKDNNLWYGYYGDGLIKKSGDSFTVYTTSNSKLPGMFVCKMGVDKSGQIWVATGGGAHPGALLKINGNDWQVMDWPSQALINDFAFDDNGTWVASNKGLHYFSK